LIPLSERMSINLNNSSLNKSIRSHEFVRGSMIINEETLEVVTSLSVKKGNLNLVVLLL